METKTNPYEKPLDEDSIMADKSYKVACVVYPTNNGTLVTGADNDTKKALRTLRSSLTDAYGRKTYTSWGDVRGKDQSGKDVKGYCISMEIDKDDAEWFTQEFWGAAEAKWFEVVAGVGYFTQTGGRCPMYLLDVTDYDTGIAAICDGFGIEVVQPGKVSRTARTPKPKDSFGTLGQLLTLCNENIENFDLAANLTTPRGELVTMLEKALGDIEAPEPSPEVLDDGIPWTGETWQDVHGEKDEDDDEE